MSQTLRLPFRLQLNGPISNILPSKKQQPHYNKELPFAINRIYKTFLKRVFKSIKKQQLQSPQSLFKSLLSSVKSDRKQQKESFLHYNVQQVNQPQVPKTIIFNLRVKKLKQDVFLIIKKNLIDVKCSQVSTVLQNRQKELLNHLVPKIQEKVCMFVFRKLLQHSREQKGKFLIVKLLDKMSKNIIKGTFYIDFFNRTKNYKSKQGRTKIAVQKIFRIIKTNTKLNLQTGIRRIQLFSNYLSLEQTLTKKKQLITRIYDFNAQRASTLQKQREFLRSLKYKLDQQSVQKSHILTDKRRALMLARTRFNQQYKQLGEQLSLTSGESYKLERTLQKEKYIVEKLQRDRKLIKEIHRNGVDFQSLTVMIYKSVNDLEEEEGEDVMESVVQLVKFYEQKYFVDVEAAPLFNRVQETRDYECRRINLLEKIIKTYQKQQYRSSLSVSQLTPRLQKNLSTSQMKLIPSTTTLTASRLLNSSQLNISLVTKSRVMEPQQFVKIKEEYNLLQQLIALVLSKSYELRIREAITAEIQQLSELLVSDLTEEEE